MRNTEQLSAAIVANVAAALAEDVGPGDITAGIIPASATAEGIVIARDAMTMAGQPWVNEVYKQLDPGVKVEWLHNDGEHVSSDTEICIIRGLARSVLSGERTALNFLQALAATATCTSRFVDAVKDTKAQILDTRKTIPGLRQAQKYAVRCGGGSNHRIGLFDALLIKENHIISAGSISAAIQLARAQHQDLPLEIEVESISELREALAAGADRLLLDNFDIEDLQLAVEINQKEGAPPADLEASGGITIDSVHAIAVTGVNYISVGALTKDINAVDLSIRFRYHS